MIWEAAGDNKPIGSCLSGREDTPLSFNLK